MLFKVWKFFLSEIILVLFFNKPRLIINPVILMNWTCLNAKIESQDLDTEEG